MGTKWEVERGRRGILRPITETFNEKATRLVHVDGIQVELVQHVVVAHERALARSATQDCGDTLQSTVGKELRVITREGPLAGALQFVHCTRYDRAKR